MMESLASGPSADEIMEVGTTEAADLLSSERNPEVSVGDVLHS